MNKSLFVFLFALLLTSSLVSALDVGYVVRTPSNMDVNENALQAFMTGEGYDVTILDDTAFDEELYDLIVISESVSDIANIFDHTDTRTIWMSNAAARKKGFSSASGLSSDRYATIEKVQTITEDYSLEEIQVYTTQDTVEYLSGCFPINSQILVSKSDITKPIIVTFNTNALLIDSSCTDRDKTISEKNLYFGLTEVDNWNSNAEDLFRNSVSWLVESQDLDGDGFDGVSDCNDDNAAVYPGATEVPYNGLDDDCSDGDLVDVDNDGYDAVSVGGDDCNDNDASINPGSSDDSKDCLNDGPVIDSFSPASPVDLLENSDNTFIVAYTDVDNSDSVIVTWKVNGQVHAFGDSFVFNKPQGNYTVVAVISDGGFEVEQSWTVSVKDSSHFTCEDVSGDICTSSEQCNGNIMSTSNSNSCCSVTCVDKDPEFSAVNLCSVRQNDIDIDFLNTDADYRIDENIRFSLRVRNNLDEDKDFDIKVYWYDYTDEEVVEKKSESLDVDDGQSEIITFEFEADQDLSDKHKYALLAIVDDGECNYDFEKFELIREDHEIIIDQVSTSNENLFCGGGFDVSVDLKNIGIDEQDDVIVSLKSSKLKIDEETEEFAIEGFEGDDEEKKKFSVRIPDNIRSGDYSINVDVKYNEDKIVREKLTISLSECGDESVQEENEIISLGKEIIDGIVSLGGSGDVEGSEIVEDTGSSPIRTIFILALVVFLGVAGFVVYKYAHDMNA